MKFVFKIDEFQSTLRGFKYKLYALEHTLTYRITLLNKTTVSVQKHLVRVVSPSFLSISAR
jgi:hypothetical protein